MAKPHGSVRIGPISLFTLIIVLCLAVLTVLSVTTSLAELYGRRRMIIQHDRPRRIVGRTGSRTGGTGTI